MDALAQDVDAQLGVDQPTQRGDAPEMLIVTALRVQAHDEARRPDPVAQGVEISRQVVAAALLARLDEHHAARVRYAEALEGLDRGNSRENRISIVGTAT